MKTEKKYEQVGDGRRVYLSPSDTREKIRRCLSCDIPQKWCDGSGEYDECRKRYDAYEARHRRAEGTRSYTPWKRRDARTIKTLETGESAIRVLILDRGMRLMEVAEDMGMKPSELYTHAYLHPPKNPIRITFPTAVRYAEYLGVELWDIVEKEEGDDETEG